MAKKTVKSRDLSDPENNPTDGYAIVSFKLSTAEHGETLKRIAETTGEQGIHGVVADIMKSKLSEEGLIDVKVVPVSPIVIATAGQEAGTIPVIEELWIE